MELRWCAVEEAARAEPGELFREAEGAWWRFGSEGWQTFRGQSWRPGPPPARLEGPAAALPVMAAVPPRSAQPGHSETSTASAAGASDARFTDFVKRQVAIVASAYLGGRLTSDAAEALLEALYAVDGGGGVWTVGVRSAVWHRFVRGQWRAEPGAPDAADLLDSSYATSSDRVEAVDAGIAEFVAAPEQIPETITDPWDPPPEPADLAWHATHRIPPGGLPAWERPDAGSESQAQLAGGLEIALLERRGAWARVSRPGGLTVWVDGRLLIG
jgi:hypothetical protein